MDGIYKKASKCNFSYSMQLASSLRGSWIYRINSSSRFEKCYKILPNAGNSTVFKRDKFPTILLGFSSCFLFVCFFAFALRFFNCFVWFCFPVLCCLREYKHILVYDHPLFNLLSTLALWLQPLDGF